MFRQEGVKGYPYGIIIYLIARIFSIIKIILGIGTKFGIGVSKYFNSGFIIASFSPSTTPVTCRMTERRHFRSRIVHLAPGTELHRDSHIFPVSFHEQLRAYPESERTEFMATELA